MSAEAMKFARNILKEVSRSFALTIPMLDDEIKDEVLLTYLEDRILDNFEDEIHPENFELQKDMMDRVSRIFSPEEYNRDEDFEIIKKNSELIADKSLQKLSKNIDKIYQIYSDFEPEVQKISHHWLKEMNQGMQKYLQKEVDTFSELDEYCYYVAGTVGGFLTELIVHKKKLSGERKEVLEDNFTDAGLFLQKVNLIRDIKDDLDNRNKNFWPLKELEITEEQLSDPEYELEALEALSIMLEDVKRHVSDLKSYYLALPDSLSGYKKFFAVNNALGLATLEKLSGNSDVFYGDKPVKVGKLQFLNIIRAPEKYFLKGCRKHSE